MNTLRVDTIPPRLRRHGHSKDECSRHCPNEEGKKRVPPHLTSVTQSSTSKTIKKNCEYR